MKSILSSLLNCSRSKALLLAGASLVVSSLNAQLEPIAYAKVAPLPQTMSKLIEVGNAISPNPQMASMPFIVGGMIGDPTFATIDPEADVSVLLFGDANISAPYVFVAKLTADSPIRAQMEAMGMTIAEAGEWTLIAQEPALLAALSESPLVDTVATKARAGDIEIGFWPARMGSQLEMLKMMLPGLLAQNNPSMAKPENQAMISTLTSIGVDEFQSAESAIIAFNLSSEAIDTAFAVNAVTDTPLHALFSMPAGGKVTEAAYVPAGDMIYGLASWNREASDAYLLHLNGKMETLPEGKIREVSLQIIDLYRRWNNAMAGTYAFAGSLEGTKFDFTQLYATRLSSTVNKELIVESMEWLQTFYKGMYDEESRTGTRMTYEFLDTAHVLRNTDIHRVNMKIETIMPEESADAMPADMLKQDMTLLFTTRDGFFHYTSSNQRMMKLLDAVQSKQPVENSIASLYTLEPGMMAIYGLDMEGFASWMADLSATVDPDAAEEVSTLFSDLELSPIETYLYIGEGTFQSKSSISVPDIAKVVTRVQEMEAAKAAEEAAAWEAEMQAAEAEAAEEGMEEEAEPQE